MATADQLLQQYQGQFVPRSFNGGFVTLSYVVSLIGAAATLELLNRRTSRNGLFNHLILLSAAVTMGGIAIWCMHFIGNVAIDLANSEAQLQISYSSGFTALSFFVPILVLLTAFVAVGANNKVSWWRIIVGGSLAGAAICGMHYLGNASIQNYNVVYAPVNVVGSALIAVAASIVALSLFFVFRASWTNSWWKRALCAIVLAGAVSGMHWCAATGTNYQLIRLNTEDNQLSRNTTVIVVICLSVGAALTLVGIAVYSSRIMRRYADKAQQVVLAAAVFDKNGRILVSPDGLLPSEKITDTYLEKTPSDHFSIGHPLFHWMFQASRNWTGLANIINGMHNHLMQLPKSGRDTTPRLINSDGQLVENYDLIFRELFCVAAGKLADKMKEPLANVGILWDEILPTGADGLIRRHRRQDIEESRAGHSPLASRHGDDSAEKGESWKLMQQEYGRGSLMFLVRRLEAARDVDRLEAAGFRFADVNQVYGIIGSTMQIKSRNLNGKLNNMATFAEENTLMEPGVHLGFFGVKARVGNYGFDVLVKKGARNLLPSMQMPLERLEQWQVDFLGRLDRMSIPALSQALDSMKKLSPREMLFASQLYDTLAALRAWIDDPIFDEAMMTSKVVQVPCRPQSGSSGANMCTMITLRLVIPIHADLHSPQCEYIPLSFFKVHQLVYKDSPQHAAFTRSVHREVSPVVNALPLAVPQPSHSRGGAQHAVRMNSMSHPFRRLGGSRSTPSSYPVDSEGNPIPTEVKRKLSGSDSNQSSSTLKLWKAETAEARSPFADPATDIQPTRQEQSSGLGGIMVSQEITVNVHEAGDEHVGGNLSHRNASQANNAPTTSRITTVTAERRAAADINSVIEMKTMAEPKTAVHDGVGMGSAVVATDRGAEAFTFVDELFAVCVDGR